MMRWLIMVAAVLLATMVQAEDFEPEVLDISAPKYVDGGWILGNKFSIPYEVNMSATVSLIIYSDYNKDRLEDVRSGNLSWRYINQVDTCVYVSAPITVEAGLHEAPWDGTMHNGEKVPMTNEFRYCLWGYAGDAVPEPAVLVAPAEGTAFTTVLVNDDYGMPLARPFLITGGLESGMPDSPSEHVRYRWVIGYDPHDESLLETSSYDAWNDNGPAFYPYGNYLYFATQSPGNRLHIRKMIWVPNGESLMENNHYTGWESELQSTTFPDVNYTPLALDGDRLYTVTRNGTGSHRKVTLHTLDVETGEIVEEKDINAQWLSPDEPTGDEFYGPVDISTDYREPVLLMLSSAADCIRQVIDPLAFQGDEREFTRWYSRDEFCSGSTLESHISYSQWSFTIDRTMGSAFSLRGPDGFPFGLFPLPAVDGMDQPLLQIDYGSAYDGLYVAREPSDTMQSDWIFLPAGKQVGGWDYIPMDYTVGEISTHYNYCRIEKPNGGEIIPGGSVYEMIWHMIPVVYSEIDISYTTDGGETWHAVNGKPGEGNVFYWNVPNVDSDRCRVRISWSSWDGNRKFSDEPFTIVKQTAIDTPSLAAFALAQNTPNPFNPSTSISYTLPEAAKVKLTVYSALGTAVGTIVDEWQPAGTHTAEWDGSAHASGLYFYRIEAEGYTATKRMVLVK